MILSKSHFKNLFRSVIAGILSLGLILPVALPIPVVAYGSDLPATPVRPFLLTPSDASGGNLSGLASDMFMSALAAFVPYGRSGSRNENRSARANALGKNVASIETSVDRPGEFEVGDVVPLSALPLDKAGNIVNGVGTRWRIENEKIIRQVNGSQAVAVRSGETKVWVTAGAKTTEHSIRVNANQSGESASVAMSDNPAETPVFESEKVEMLTSAENNVGSLVGQSGTPTRSVAAATETSENAGSSNFSFNLPVASLPGRGLDASVGITYNSRVWSRSASLSGSSFEFNPNKNWLSPGFEIGFGDIVPFGALSSGSVSGYLLTGPDGSRHQLLYKSVSGTNYTYESNDGTFIQAVRSGTSTLSALEVSYPNGTKVTYGVTTSSGKRFPVQITDRNGNYITITYLTGDTSGRINTIADTLNRYITFNYDSSSPQKLVSVSVPGYNGSPTPRETIQFFYAPQTLAKDDIFASTLVTAPTSFTALKYVYFPGTGTGYKYDYSEHSGSIKKVSQRRGMTVSGGGVSAEGTEAASTEYDYPTTAQELSDVPTFTTRTDGWLETTGWKTAITTFLVEEASTPLTCTSTPLSGTDGRKTVTVTAPDASKSISVSMKNAGDWDDGLLCETRIETSSPAKTWSKTNLFWEQGNGSPGGRANPRLDRVEVTNDAAQTKATSFDYDQFNNTSVVREHDFAAPGTLGTELRRTETTYENGTGWIDSRLLRLPKTVQTVVNNVVVSKAKYEYDNYTNNALVNASGVVHHDARFNPFGPPTRQVCHWECGDEYSGYSGGNDGADTSQLAACPGGNPPVRVCETVTLSTNPYRGNVTKVISFPDTSASDGDADNPVQSFKYDITGNVVESIASCSCDYKATQYSVDNYFAYPVSVTKNGGTASMTTSATYDFNTGAIKSSTDENAQISTVTYDAGTMRASRVDRPDGSYAKTEFNDTVFPYHVKSTASLDSNREVSSWSFSDGRGNNFMNRSQTDGGYLSSDVEFDEMGRAVKSFNLYTVGTLTATRPTSGIAFSQITNRDGLGRALTTSLQDSTTVTANYNGLIATVTDQAGKTRRQIADALGRVRRVDEPNGTGALDNGDINSPHQPTYYEYDGNDNLTRVIQTDTTVTPNVEQERKFQYDAISRLTHERQVEATATLDADGVKQTSGGLWTGVYKYNPDNKLVEGVDARGVKTTFTYDGFERIKTVAYSGETGYITPSVTYTYDEAESGFYNVGRLTKVQTAAESTYGTPATVHNFRYDKAGQVKKQTTSIGSESYLQEYSYNLAGQLTSQKYPSGKIVEYEVDNFGRLSGVADAQREYLTGVAFNSQGLLSQLNLGNGDQETFSYNDRFQMQSQSLMKGTTVLQRWDYGYNKIDDSGDPVDNTNNGQLAQIDSYIGTTKQWTQKFQYDSVGRLKKAEERRDTGALTYKQVFDYDRFGNLYRKAANNPSTGQEDPLPYIPIEESTSPSNGDIDKYTNRFKTDTTYNEAGMVTQDDKFRDMAYSYDANGRMIKATRPITPDAWTVYDALGNRVATNVNGVWRFMIYDAFGKLVAEYGAAEVGFGGVKYVQQDWQGSVRTITNENGFVVSRTDHTAFGEAIGAGVGLRGSQQGYYGKTSTKQGYGLTEKDEGTGLGHTWFRKNEGSAGRWTSPDPYLGSMKHGDPQSFNRYSYVINQPTNFVDPSGLLMMVIRYCEPDRWDEKNATIYGGACYDIVIDLGGGGGGTVFPREPGSGPGGGGVPQNDKANVRNQLDLYLQFKSIECEKAINVMGLADQQILNGFDKNTFLPGGPSSNSAHTTAPWKQTPGKPKVWGSSSTKSKNGVVDFLGKTTGFLIHEVAHAVTHLDDAGMYNKLLSAQKSGKISGLPALSKTMNPSQAVSGYFNDACRSNGPVDSPMPNGNRNSTSG